MTFVLGLTDDELKALPEGIEAERTGVNAAYNDDVECERLANVVSFLTLDLMYWGNRVRQVLSSDRSLARDLRYESRRIPAEQGQSTAERT